jgi:hypothetical protein
MGKNTIGAKHTPIGFSDSRKTARFFDLRKGPPHTLSAEAQHRVSVVSTRVP